MRDSAHRLYRNVDGAKLPLSVLRQYMPAQYDRVRRGEIEWTAEALVYDKVRDFLDDYFYACGK